MKKAKKCMMVLIAVLAIYSTATAQSLNDQGLIGKAHAAPRVAQCIAQAQAQGYNVDANVEVTGICFVSGFLRTVNFYYILYGTPCNPEDDCLPPLPVLVPVASVTFGCADEIISAQCY